WVARYERDFPGGKRIGGGPDNAVKLLVLYFFGQRSALCGRSIRVNIDLKARGMRHFTLRDLSLVQQCRLPLVLLVFKTIELLANDLRHVPVRSYNHQVLARASAGDEERWHKDRSTH